MNILFLVLGLILGAMLYRLGRKEGERGRVMPLLPRGKMSATPTVEGLLTQIEKYDGNTTGRKEWSK